MMTHQLALCYHGDSGLNDLKGYMLLTLLTLQL